MPISEAKIREMRENSARKYAEQLAREKEQAEEYDKERKKNVSKMMSVNEKIALVALLSSTSREPMPTPETIIPTCRLSSPV